MNGQRPWGQIPNDRIHKAKFKKAELLKGQIKIFFKIFFLFFNYLFNYLFISNSLKGYHKIYPPLIILKMPYYYKRKTAKE